jgi:hypothetical protein
MNAFLAIRSEPPTDVASGEIPAQAIEDQTPEGRTE